ncbi:phage tail tape measure protein [Xylanibacter rodentium]|jgi:TP901 family phage tail tape measure protein|uniref:phage tail tape measure protein n=1 Tax=Xylanibacter rodentium TaxID=2736289 RepID=UPI00256F0184|nr:phage tail tape measure protein [Xylanibacter rodentium]
MANKIEYIFSLRDKISAKLGGITATSDKTVTALSGVREKVASVDAVCKDTGKTVGSLKMKVDALQAEREWIPADNLPAIREYNKEISRLTKEIDALETASGGGKFKKWASDAFEAIPGAGLLKNPLVTGMAAIGFAGKAGMSFDEGMAKVNITAQLDEAGLSDLKKKLKTIADDNKTDVVLAPVGFERINSQLNDVDLSLSILDASLKGSKAGFTQLDTVSAALAQTLSIVGKENTTAAEVLDTFFAAKRVGAGEFSDFARYMPNLIAGASNLGVAYKEVAGTFAYMTGKGQSAERAAVLMENAFSILGRGEVRDKLAKSGVKVFDEAGKIRSLVDIFSDLQGVMAGLNDEQKSSFLEKLGMVDKEAKNAFAILTSDITKYNASMKDVVNSSGETDKALEYSQNSVQRLTEVWNKFKNIGVTVGEIILPVISAGLSVADVVLTGVSSTLNIVVGFFSSWYSLLREGNPLVVGLTAALGFYTIAMGANYATTQKAVIIGGIKKVMDIAQTAATWGLTTAQWALNAAFYASPLGWVALAIGAVIAAVTYCWQKFEGFRVAILGVWGVIKEFGATLLDSVVKPFKQVLSGIGGVCSAIVNLVKGNFKEAAAAAKDGFKNIGEGVLGANPVSILYDTAQNGNYSQAWEKGKQAGRDSWVASQQKTDDVSTMDKLIPTPAPLPEPGNMPGTNFNDLMAKLGKDKKGAKAKKVLKLDDDVKNLNETAVYTAVTRKLAPLTVSLKPTEAKERVTDKVLPAGNVIDAKTAFAAKADDRTQSYEPEKENYLSDILSNVRKIAAAVMLPLAVTLSSPEVKGAEQPVVNLASPELVAQSPAVQLGGPVVNVPEFPKVPVPDVSVPPVNVPPIVSPAIELDEPVVNVPEFPAASVPDVKLPQLSDAYSMPEKTTEKSSFISENTTTVETGKTVHVGKVCDSVVIHVANTDNKGSETIRAEIMRVLDELAEG